MSVYDSNKKNNGKYKRIDSILIILLLLIVHKNKKFESTFDCIITNFTSITVKITHFAAPLPPPAS